MNVSVIGLGNIGYAISKGLSSHVNVFGIDKNKYKNERTSLYATVPNNIEDAISIADIVFLCIRTNQAIGFLDQNRALLDNKIIVLFQAGVKLNDVEKNVPENATLIRAITNVNVASQNGFSVILKSTTYRKYSQVSQLLSLIGQIQEVETEEQLEMFSLIPGCLPAVVSLLVHYLEKIAEQISHDDVSYKETIFYAIFGTILNIKQLGIEPLEAAKSVGTPGGVVEKELQKLIDSHVFEQLLNNFLVTLTKPN